MSGRQIFSESEKVCLQELIIKHDLNSLRTIGAGNPAVKKTAWERLTNEYNSIETNTRRTTAQLKKCWDNLKTRRKQALASEKRERMRTGGGPYVPQPSTSQENLDDALLANTDVEMQFAIDSDLIVEAGEEIDTGEINTVEIDTTESNRGIGEDPSTLISTEDVSQAFEESGVAAVEPIDSHGQGICRGVQSTPAQVRSTGRGSGSRLSDYDNMSQAPGVRNIRSHVINEEFQLRKCNYKTNQEREEELHKLKKSELEFTLKTAEEIFKKACIERQCAEKKAIIVLQCAEEELRYIRAKREAAELN